MIHNNKYTFEDVLSKECKVDIKQSSVVFSL